MESTQTPTRARVAPTPVYIPDARRVSQGSQAERDTKAEERLTLLLAAADDALKTNLPTRTVLDTAADGTQAILYEGTFSPELLTAAWAAMPANVHTLCQDRAKAHVHMDVAAIARLGSGGEFLQVIATILAPLLREGPYRVIGCELVARYANADPFHQDIFTGRGAFARDVVMPMSAMRLLLDFGDYVGEHLSRVMAFKIDGKLVRETKARLVGMSALAAGSGGAGPVFHGRVGNGVTVSVDIVLPTRDRSGNAYVAGTPCFRFFGTTMAYLRHGMNAVGLDRRDGNHGRGRVLLTREHTVGATKAAMVAADQRVATADPGPVEETVVQDADVLAREACYNYIAGIGTYDEDSICTETDKVFFFGGGGGCGRGR
jgi:hypothetical protein